MSYSDQGDQNQASKQVLLHIKEKIEVIKNLLILLNYILSLLIMVNSRKS